MNGAASALSVAAAVAGLGVFLLSLGPGIAPALCGPAASAWTFDLWVTTPLAAAAALYALGAFGLAQRGAHRERRRAGAFCAGWLVLAAALVSPLHRIGERLFTAHMVEHELVMAIAAPLLVLARPAGALLWGLPARWRRAVGQGMAQAPARAVWAALTAPAVATFAHGLAIWLWHAPPLFESALAQVALHRLQHMAFIATAVVFWWSMLRRADAGAAAWHVFATLLHTSLLGALLTFAPHVLFPLQTTDATAWGLTPLEDQQLAGVIMWVPAGAIYGAACLGFLALWIRRSGSGREATHALPLV